MKQFNYDLMRLTKQFREGSFRTQAARWRALDLAARELYDLGFRNLRATGLKMRHVKALNEHWRRRELSIGTIKNRMSYLRWWADKIGKAGMIPASNFTLGIPDRQYVTNENKAVYLDGRLDKITDPHIRLSLELQAAFGLRKEESMVPPSYADRGDKLVLKASWTKGGRPREIPIRNERQMEVLGRAHDLAGKGSMIPPERSYRQQEQHYDRQCQIAGFHRMHGLRYAYAHERYRELTGWDCPALGGTASKELTPEQRIIDHAARMKISCEMGHGREQIVTTYLGR